VSNGAAGLIPSADNAQDLGHPSFRWRNLTLAGNATATGFIGNGSALTGLNLTNTSNYYIGNITGTANQIIVIGADAVNATKTLSLPQNINITSSPTFANLTDTALTAGWIPFAGTGGLLSGVSNLTFNSTTNKMGLFETNCVNPTELLELGEGHLRFNHIANPTAPTLTLVETGTGVCTNGTHRAFLVWVTAEGFSQVGVYSNTVTVDDTHKQITVTIPSFPTGVTAVNIYMSRAALSGMYYVTQRATSADYTFNTADAGLTVSWSSPQSSSVPFGSTAGLIYSGTLEGLQISGPMSTIGLATGGAVQFNCGRPVSQNWGTVAPVARFYDIGYGSQYGVFEVSSYTGGTAMQVNVNTGQLGVIYNSISGGTFYWTNTYPNANMDYIVWGSGYIRFRNDHYTIMTYPVTFQVQGSTGKFGTMFATLAAPTGVPGSGGSMVNGTYYYVITAIDPVGGYSVKGTQSAAQTVTTGPTGSVALTWTAVNGAASYKIYRTTTTGSYVTPSYIAQVTAPTVTYTDVAAAPSAGAPVTAQSNTGYINYFNNSGTSWINSGNLGIMNLVSATAYLHLGAGTATASTAPLKFTSGTLLGTAEAGAVEFLTDKFYGTITTGAARKTFAFLESPIFTTPDIGAATTASQITSTLATGTSPFAVSSTTTNTNFSADMVDGIHGYGYTLQGGSNALNPVDATTYYCGGIYAGAASVYDGVQRIRVPKAGTIKYIYVDFLNAATGTAETSTISLRLNSSADTSISAVVKNDATVNSVSNTGLSIAVVAGDYIELKWVTPTWATNPTSVFITFVVYIE
jgi:hypothetical protein